ncbi:hypothetical protein KZJ38_21880 [Paraburkholderia edwinii]|jgi:hypothetical protein|uniref:Uncharacterized protein n=1 Tax=Paraburkholderia edwinii TaxID=2861782 RepID=A0ABX8UKF2_9BURK|nr:hypothetical protein [Paraburkholderia edwinii]QYD68827.1 hypothetical protein KZJ38_21880 [Paraburkholderia edwinii]
MVIGGSNPYIGHLGAAQTAGYDHNGSTYGDLTKANAKADAAANRAAETGTPQDAQAAKQAANKESEAAQAAATKEQARNQAVMALLR